MPTVSGNMNPFNCYPCCCNVCTDCSPNWCFTSANCSGENNTCSKGACNTCNNNQNKMAYTKIGSQCDTSGGCRPLPTIACGTSGTIRDYTTGKTLSGVAVADCGPAQPFVCNQNFIGCLTAQAWLSLGHTSVTGGPDSCCYGYGGSSCPF